MKEIEAKVTQFQTTAKVIKDEISKVIVGQEKIVNQVMLALFSGGHVLLEGVPGLGKTMLVRTVGQVLQLNFKRIQFTPDLMPADIMGTKIIADNPNGGREFRFQPGPVFTNVLLADEINRATPKTQSALLEAMQENTVTVSGETRQLPAPFFVLATQNPLEMEGTYPLPEAQMDRFLFKVKVPFPQREELLEIMSRTTGKKEEAAAPVASGDQVIEMMSTVRQVMAAKAVTDYAVRLVLATHPETDYAPESVKRFVRYGSSPRGAQALVIAAKAHALLKGRLNISYNDIKDIAIPALCHRFFLNFEGEAEGIAPEQLLEEIIAGVPTTEG
ncbi:MoxR family ATPase [Metallumcola ferriviriculae]|uniref:MoxR family ATPase n=1 Tax=Metallumcola ferriviriculae TaxID=3039180 RepID=A0AAU0UH82_9FIRM|nr:MoxR family ATPase [Desulfitibacteraceae bacterium MK1]